MATSAAQAKQLASRRNLALGPPPRDTPALRFPRTHLTADQASAPSQLLPPPSLLPLLSEALGKSPNVLHARGVHYVHPLYPSVLERDLGSYIQHSSFCSRFRVYVGSNVKGRVSNRCCHKAVWLIGMNHLQLSVVMCKPIHCNANRGHVAYLQFTTGTDDIRHRSVDFSLFVLCTSKYQAFTRPADRRYDLPCGIKQFGPLHHFKVASLVHRVDDTQQPVKSKCRSASRERPPSLSMAPLIQFHMTSAAPVRYNS